jgi:hypothetical protein
VLVTPIPSVQFEIYSADEEGMKQLDRAVGAAEESFVQEDDIDFIVRLLQLNRGADPL